MGGRPTSPMVPGQQQLRHHPAPINPNLQYGQAPVQQMNAPPGYAMQQGVAHGIPPNMSQAQYGRSAVEIEGGGRAKAQLIVGIDFGTTFSGVAFAFATNNEAREDIITEWPGAGTHTKQKVCTSYNRRPFLFNVCLLDSHRPLLRSIPKSGGMGP